MRGVSSLTMAVVVGMCMHMAHHSAPATADIIKLGMRNLGHTVVGASRSGINIDFKGPHATTSSSLRDTAQVVMQMVVVVHPRMPCVKPTPSIAPAINPTARTQVSQTALGRGKGTVQRIADPLAPPSWQH